MERTTSHIALLLALPAMLLAAPACNNDNLPTDDDLPADDGGDGGSSSSNMQEGGSSEGGGGAGGEMGTGGSIQANVITKVGEASAPDVVPNTHAAMAPDGTIYVLWGEATPAGAVTLKVTRSTDGGVSFEAPTIVNTAGIQINTWEESMPKLGVSDNRVAVAFSDFNATNVWVTHSDTAGSLGFSAPQAIDGTGVQPRYQFPAVVVDKDDEIWVTWARNEGMPPTTQRMWAARETEGFAPVGITDESVGIPCVCCGVEMVSVPSGEIVVVYRGFAKPRNQFTVQHPGDASTGSASWTEVQASTTNWTFPQEFICPENGSAMAVGPSGKITMGWTDPTSGDPRIWLVDSADAGLSWTNQRLASDPFPGAHQGPLLAIEQDGFTWLGWAQPFNFNTPQVTSSTDGQTFSNMTPLQIQEGELFKPTLIAGTPGAFAVGITGLEAVWIVSLNRETP